jgi:zinc transporter 1
MNMRAIFLHALGDALGNVGVILTGLLIWLVPRHAGIVYADPVISLIITAIIFTSALPLGKCRILLYSSHSAQQH